MTSCGYIAFIDEAGDFGLRTVSPIDAKGASEWFVLSAVVVRKERAEEVEGWLSQIRTEARNTQSTDLHFRKLSSRQKRIVCQLTAKLPVRLFVVVSNKRNMRGHDNPYARSVSGHQHWFYLWIARLLLERVTDFCAARNAMQQTPDKTVEIIFSRREDFWRHEFTDYFTRLWNQKGTPYLNKRTINWSVFDVKMVDFVEHNKMAGLQFADVAASAFYQAVSLRSNGECDPEFAKLLSPRVYRPLNSGPVDEGFTAWPFELGEAQLTDQQKEVFRYYGIDEKRLC